jgi:hypothetical protein
MPYIPESLPTPGNMITQPTPFEKAAPQPNDAIAQATAMYQKPLDLSSEVAQDELKKTNNAVQTEAFSHVVALKNNMIFGENGVQSKKGKDALQLTQTMMPAWQKGVQEVTKNMTPEQLNDPNFIDAIRKQTGEFNQAVAIQEHEQRQNYFIGTGESLIKNLQTDSIQNYSTNPSKADSNLMLELAEQKKLSRLKGESDDQFRQEAMALINQHHDGIITRLIQTNQAPQAQVYFDQHQNDITGDMKNTLVQSLQAARVSDLAIEFGKKLSTTYTLPGGFIDRIKLQDDIFALPGPNEPGGLNQDAKNQLLDKVNALATARQKGDFSLKASQKASFQQQLAMAKDNGVPLTDFQAKIDAMKLDPATRALFNAQAAKAYAPGKDDQDDKATVATLQSQILSGTGDPRAVLEDAFKNGKVGSKSYATLDKQIDNYILHGPPGEAQQAWGDITKMANQRFGAHSTDAQDFLYYMYQHSAGKIDGDLRDYAKKELAGLPHKDFNVWSRVKEYRESQGVTGNVPGWFGRDTAVENAVKSIQAAGKPVTPAMIDWVLKKAPDGKF